MPLFYPQNSSHMYLNTCLKLPESIFQLLFSTLLLHLHSQFTNESVICFALLWVKSYGTLASINNRNDCVYTVFSGKSNKNELWTTPVPDWMSLLVFPGYAPLSLLHTFTHFFYQGGLPKANTGPAHAFTATVPYFNPLINLFTSFPLFVCTEGWTITVQERFPHIYQ